MNNRTDDLAAVTAFLAMANKEKLLLNSHRAQGVWEAWRRLLNLSPAKGGELLCRMLPDEFGLDHEGDRE